MVTPTESLRVLLVEPSVKEGNLSCERLGQLFREIDRHLENPSRQPLSGKTLIAINAAELERILKQVKEEYPLMVSREAETSAARETSCPYKMHRWKYGWLGAVLLIAGFTLYYFGMGEWDKRAYGLAALFLMGYVICGTLGGSCFDKASLPGYIHLQWKDSIQELEKLVKFAKGQSVQQHLIEWFALYQDKRHGDLCNNCDKNNRV